MHPLGGPDLQLYNTECGSGLLHPFDQVPAKKKKVISEKVDTNLIEGDLLWR